MYFLFFCSLRPLYAQENTYFKRNEIYRKALKLYDLKNYSTARTLFHQVFSMPEQPESSEQKTEQATLYAINARFYEALCEMHLQNTASEQKLLSLIASYPYTPMARAAALQIGNYFFSSGNYALAAKWFKDIRANSLAADERDELLFKYGFCLFTQNQPLEARDNFKKVLDHRGPFQDDALYYDAHLAYDARDYETALGELKQLSPTSKYHEIYPVYLSQIYLIKGDPDAAIRIAKPLVDSSSNRYKPLLCKALGSAYFEKEEYSSAITQFQAFNQGRYANTETDQERYQIGYCYYKTAEYDKAIEELSPLSKDSSVYAQNGLYTLGLCYLKTKQNAYAKSAFQAASQLRGSSDISEASLLYYINLSYEAGLDKDALDASTIFVKNYPHSQSLTEINIIKAELLMHTYVYGEAYQALMTLPSSTNEQGQLSLQKAAYLFGLETYNKKNYAYANRLFDESLQHPKNADLVSLANYWKGESNYDLGAYDAAIHSYQRFLSQSNAPSLPIYTQAYYGIGYAFYKKGDYTQALNSFTKFCQSETKDLQMKSDATMRMADCYFMLKNYAKANSLYSNAIDAKGTTSDYALFQSAMLLGLQGNASGKLTSLQNLLRTYPTSSYADDAQFEIASSYFVSGKLTEARDAFTILLTKYPESSYVPKSLLDMGLSYYNSNDDEHALEYYKRVVRNYPGSQEAKNALAAIKNVYVDQGNPGGFVSYVNSNGLTKISETGEDSLSYQSANAKYLNGDAEESIASFNSYLKKFPRGAFASDAHYYRAQALQKQNRAEEALADYKFLAANSTNTAYVEFALVGISTTYLSQQKWELAIPYLKRLVLTTEQPEITAMTLSGLANCYSETGEPDSTIYYARKVLANKKSTPVSHNEANLLLGKAELQKGDTSAAAKPLLLAGKAKDIYAAEARYLRANVLYNARNYKSSMKVLFELTKQLSNFDYWVAKAFVLLADNYRAKGDNFQATSTLNSVIANYKPDDDVKRLARKKLNELEKIKK